MTTNATHLSEEDIKKQQRKNKLRDFKDRFKLGSHYGIERFGVMVGACAVSGALILSGTVVNAMQVGKADISAIAQYTSGFVTSKTQNPGSVTGVYTNKANTRALVMMRFESPEAMPANANDYYAAVSGIVGQKVSGAPTDMDQPTVGSIYSFGNTGNIGVLLEAPTGFSDQLVNITMQSNRDVSPAVPMSDEDLVANGYDVSFRQNDQWRVIINPSGDSAMHLEGLEGEGKPDARAIYADTALINREVALRKQANDELAELQTYMTRISELEDRMATTKVSLGAQGNVSLVPPPLSPYMEGDDLVGRPAGEIEEQLTATDDQGNDISSYPEETESMSSRAVYLDYDYPLLAARMSAEENADNVVETSSGDVEYYVPNTYALHSRNIIPGGIGMDWRKRTIVEGYLDSIVPQGEDKTDYLLKLMETQAPSAESEHEWVLSNGKKLDDLNPTDPRVQPLLSLSQSAEEAYQNYVGLKIKYQRITMMSLLQLETELDSIVEQTEINSGADGSSSDANNDGVGVDVRI